MRVACTVVRADTVPSENVEVSDGLHQMSVFLFLCCEFNLLHTVHLTAFTCTPFPQGHFP